jgi:manganese transport protein
VKVLQVGGIVGTTALLLHYMAPQVSVGWWCWITVVVVAILVSGEGYRVIERTCVFMVGAFTVATLVAVISLQWTEYAVTGSQLAEGFRFRLPTGGLLAALGVFGLTGVGGDEIMHYTYWLIEKGYAAKTGKRDPNDPAWPRRARAWIGVMYLDAFVSMVVYTVVTAAFYVLGAAVLHARGEVPGEAAIVPTLSAMYTESLGGWARGLFLGGAFFVLFSTLFSALAAWTRMFADAGGKLGLFNFEDLTTRRRAMRWLACILPSLWASVYLLHGKAVDMVMLGGVGTAAILLVVVVGAIHFRYRSTAPELKPGPLYDAALWISIVSIIVVAGLAVGKPIQKFIAG